MKAPSTPRSFVFNANAFAVSGIIRRPFHALIPTQTMVTLPTIGGHAEALVEDFSFRNILSFKRAYTQVVGRSNDKQTIFYTNTSVTIEGLNVMDMFTADVITTRIGCTYNLHDLEDPNDDTADILLLGSEFDGVRIGGAKANISLDQKLFLDYPNYQTFKQDYDNDAAFRNRIKQQFNWDAPDPVPPDTPEAVRLRYKWAERFADELPEFGSVLCTPVKKIEGDAIDPRHVFGNIIEMPNFGTIYLADLYMDRFARRLEMLRIELAPPFDGTICDGGQGGGNGYPPSGA